MVNGVGSSRVRILKPSPDRRTVVTSRGDLTSSSSEGRGSEGSEGRIQDVEKGCRKILDLKTGAAWMTSGIVRLNIKETGFLFVDHSMSIIAKFNSTKCSTTFEIDYSQSRIVH